MKPPNELQLRSQAERLLERHPATPLLAFHCAPGYTGPAELALGERRFRVVEVQSPLHFFQIAAESEMEQLATVALCPSRDWLSQDLHARLPDGQLRQLDPWEAVRDLFRATDVESALLRRREELPQWILELGPQGNYPAAVGGTLTQELFWDTLLRGYFGLDNECHDALQFLLVLTHKLEMESPRAVSAGLVKAAAGWLSERGGVTAGQLLHLFVAHGATDTLALVCVLEALFLSAPEPETLVAQGRLERYLDGRAMDPAVGKALGEVMRRLVGLPQPHEWLGPVLTRARQLLTEIRAEQATSQSLIFEEGWQHRLDLVASEILSGRSPEASIESLHEHLLCESRAADLERLEMAVRLQRFLADPPVLPRALPAWVETYVQSVAWADRAAQVLAPLSSSAQLGEAFRHLLQQFSVWRETFNEGFARAVVGGDSAAFGVETFLTRHVAPLVSEKGQRVLVIVLDGCSQPVLLDLLESLDQRNWSHYLPQRADFTALLSAFPSVTEVTRTSLLCGDILAGDASTEKERFCSHPALKPLCRRDYPPQLFHKKDLDQALQRIRSDDYKLVGVVVNAIDDTLAKDEQLSLEWTSDLIAPLEPLLLAAREQNRVVVLVSDHGHVLEQGTLERPTSGGAGNRWQPGTEAQEGELVVTGARLRKTDSARILWSEKIRYGPKKRGYHGGLSPQEMVCALAVLASPGQKVKGWREAARPAPGFWFPAAQELPASSGGVGQGDLFAQDAWERFIAKEEVVRRQAVLPVPRCLPDAFRLLASFPDGLPVGQLASQLGLTRAQLTRMLPEWTHWMNIEGRALLRVERGRVRLETLSGR